MPFTAAHPAAVLPLRRVCPRPLDWSALVIGSLTPDLECFLTLRPEVKHGVTFAGSFYFCLPAGLVLFLLFHALVKRPATLLLPTPWRRRAWGLARRPMRSKPGDLASIAASILIGAWLHQAWDLFTHADRWGAAWSHLVPRGKLAAEGTVLATFGVLQHASTLLGLACLVVAAVRWRRRAPPAAAPSLKPVAGALLVGLLGTAAPAFGLAHALRQVPAIEGTDSLVQLAGHAAIGSASLAGLLLLLVGTVLTPLLGRLPPSESIRVREATTPEDHVEIRRLFEAYARSLDFDLSFQGFRQEIDRLPGPYAPPEGCLLVGELEGRTAGCVALRPLEPGVCEMKRLWVAPEDRRCGLGRALARAIVEEARRRGYARMRLDTVPSMKAAIALYESLGFRPIGRYRPNPIDGALFLELDLGSAPPAERG
jgi:ribosomal protein S18 acetylase RimI-like enzyme